MLPKVKFEFTSQKDEARMLHKFCKPRETGWNWSEYIFKYHPSLKEHFSKQPTEKERIRIIKAYTKKFWKKEYEQLKNQKSLFKKEWNKINDKYMKTLSEVLETDWPKNRKIIRAWISINPICPRSIESWEFLIFYLFPLRYVRHDVAHETMHFLYFKKWKEVFPKADKKTFEPPHLEWHLSEILASTILNNENIQKLIKCRAEGYEEYVHYRKNKIRKRSLIQHFENLYKQNRKKKEPFAQFLQTAYKEAQKHKNKILNA